MLRLGSGIKSDYYGYKFIQLEKCWLPDRFSSDKLGSPAARWMAASSAAAEYYSYSSAVTDLEYVRLVLHDLHIFPDAASSPSPC